MTHPEYQRKSKAGSALVRRCAPQDETANDVGELKALVRQAFDEIAALRAEVRTLAGSCAPVRTANPEAANDDRAEPDLWLDVTSAAERLGREVDTVRAACRNNGIGRKEGRVWHVNMTWARRHFRMV